MVLMHTVGLVIYIQFEGVLDIRHATQLHDVKSKTKVTRCVCVCVPCVSVIFEPKMCKNHTV